MKTIEELKEEVKALQAQIETLEGLPFKKGEFYYCIYTGGEVSRLTWYSDKPDISAYLMGNTFQSHQGALDEVRRRKIRQKLKVMTGGWIPDWDNKIQPKYYIFYDCGHQDFYISYSTFCKGVDRLYFPTQEIAQTVIDTMTDDLKFLIGVK